MERLLQDFVTEQAAKRPASRAVVCDNAFLTWGELEALSNRVARLLNCAGCRPGDRVALLMPKSSMAIAALLGIYKADATYVPLDPASPAARLKTILDSCENRLLVAAGSASPILNEILSDERYRGRFQVVWLGGPRPVGSPHVDLSSETLADLSDAPLPCWNRPDDPAHILFTSGSTGTPKGVVITHANVMAIIRWAVRHFSIDASDRISSHPPLYFDMFFLDLFCAAATGAELHLVPPLLNTFPNKLADFIRSSELTQWFSVPSVLDYMAKFDVVVDNDFPALRRVLWAGDTLPTPALIHWMQRLPHVTFVNMYGPTETTIVSSHYTVPACPRDPRAPIPIGTACEGEELLVMDESLRPTPAGQTGELFIGGAGLARGYWRNPDGTDAAFLRDPRRPSGRLYRTGDLARVGDDGYVYFLGRRDSQIKSRGYRIELGEIEAALRVIPGVQDCAVVALDAAGFEGATICCAYTPVPGTDASPAALRQALARLLPRYMLPVSWLPLHAMPSNQNGKTDRRRIRDLFKERVTLHEAPSGRRA